MKITANDSYGVAYFYKNGTQRTRISGYGTSYFNGGSLAIGKTLATQKLDVAGGIGADSILIDVVKLSTTYPDVLKIRGYVEITQNLYVDGSMNVDEIAADSIVTDKVVINDWVIEAPDYVFDSTYNLRSLSEVESYIKQNSHLPDVPSADDMKKSGVELVEMNMTLLKKVEELTLYVIEQNKKIESLQKQMTEIQ